MNRIGKLLCESFWRSKSGYWIHFNFVSFCFRSSKLRILNVIKNARMAVGAITTKSVNVPKATWDNIVRQLFATPLVWMVAFVLHQLFAPARRDTKEGTVKEVNINTKISIAFHALFLLSNFIWLRIKSSTYQLLNSTHFFSLINLFKSFWKWRWPFCSQLW